MLMADRSASEIAHQEAHINQNLSPTLIIVCSIFTGAALFCLIARVTIKHLTKVSLGLDDFLAVAAGVNFSAPVAFMTKGILKLTISK